MGRCNHWVSHSSDIKIQRLACRSEEMSFQGFAFFDEKIICSFCLFVFFFGIRATKCPDHLYGMLISLYQVLIKKVVLESLFFQSAAPLTKFLILYNFFTIYITDV